MDEQVRSATAVVELRAAVRGWRKHAERVALVPTMGALHDGHLALVRLAKTKAQRVVTSVFVNPMQFAPHEDFERYPRTLADDVAKLGSAGCDLVWAPSVQEMYPEGFATRIEPAGAAEGLESEFRPHFFAGVATVCTKLFSQVSPDVAIFGEKDYQQLTVIRQTVRDLDLPLEIVGAPIVREADGLAMSSRNSYLSANERKIAPKLHKTLQSVARGVSAKGRDVTAEQIGAMCDEASRSLMAAGFTKVDYVSARDAVTLREPSPADGRPIRILGAAWLGRTRLIDNVGI